MKFTHIIASGIILVGLSGCSDSAEDVAFKMCELGKKGDVLGMKAYATPSFAAQLDQVNKMVELALSTEYTKQEFEKQVALSKNIDCATTTQISDVSDTKKRVVNQATSQTYTLELIDGEWKVIG